MEGSVVDYLVLPLPFPFSVPLRSSRGVRGTDIRGCVFTFPFAFALPLPLLALFLRLHLALEKLLSFGIFGALLLSVFCLGSSLCLFDL